ncbi:tRNA (adenosine(37)-N6)-threonylcarbamoyltransferase complex dimerization subunit type 1 TsaB [Microbacterium sp. LRZ72]|uniref:tRNA (adenosine(37)-N6)-threonylcarbamoyltransferase complex dimerization subunit type 1 TsaB n=1 Tax=Microbacterium sp. LRZ72 TaxID=2942481 RepID=UPI0029BCA52F|nr:tRNA (adenosine(37)-N6)-threonylcarbamoyltransferase complex dimerization subunit type 1 TsaB [Microbacterium sp. LRZ72]MDX2377232.1 tRNA (adenosine(37)-N6)-threonylcarbamoyltransferase complex dimerization subunit type 1 TsaB [Microbacterium sp. LRZ72]
MILAIDTSLGSGVAVVGLDGRVAGEATTDDPLGHAEIIGDLLERALAQAGIAPADLTHVAAGMGPGPFTGLRIGVAAARAFALARGIPVVPVVSHDAAALAHDDTARAYPLAIVTDARRRELAYTLYSGIGADGIPVRLTEPALSPRDDLDAALAPRGAARVDVATIAPAAVGRVAAALIATDAVPAASEPLYLRAPDVTLGHIPKRVSA